MKRHVLNLCKAKIDQALKREREKEGGDFLRVYIQRASERRRLNMHGEERESIDQQALRQA